jgi:predicted type IV restriction endonuclease
MMPQFYKDNRLSMLKYAELVHQGAGVKLSDRNSQGKVEVLNAAGQSLGTYGFQRGEFYKVLSPGRYTLVVDATVRGQRVNKRVEVEVNTDVRDQAFVEL